ncbi:unnamed protein product [Urochloa decumbens]|uniref:Uncharacterized protein n=1 Tax=Urochloa decumbens TaxID=240449 RepID=A0ABC9DE51_9POAL
MLTLRLSQPPLLRRHVCCSENPSPFAAEDYLVATCGLTRTQALEASKKISHLKSPVKPDAVLVFLDGLGIFRGDVAAVVANDPLFLCADVKKTLRSVRRILEFWLPIFGSLTTDLEKVTKPNLDLLQQRGINPCDLPHAFTSRMVIRRPEHLQEALARVDNFGIEQGSWAFRQALITFAILSREKLTKNILQLFEKLGWSKDEIALAVKRALQIIGLTHERVRGHLEFLIGDVGLEIPDIARSPTLLLYSMERRLLPRHCLMNFLKAKGFLNAKLNLYYIAILTNEKFLHRFVHPYEENVPGLAVAYASNCAGKHQWELLYETIEEKRKS